MIILPAATERGANCWPLYLTTIKFPIYGGCLSIDTNGQYSKTLTSGTYRERVLILMSNHVLSHQMHFMNRFWYKVCYELFCFFKYHNSLLYFRATNCLKWPGTWLLRHREGWLTSSWTRNLSEWLHTPPLQSARKGKTNMHHVRSVRWYHVNNS